MLTQEQRQTFHERGLLHFPSFLPKEKVSDGRDAITSVLSKINLWQDGAWHLDALSQSETRRQATRLVKGVNKANALQEVITTNLLDLASELVDGRTISQTVERPQLLFTFPNAESWVVPHNGWHLDCPRLPKIGIPGVQMFTFLDTVSPQGGGTLIVTGSHRLLNTGQEIRSKDVKRLLKQEPYFSDLMSADLPDRNRFLHESGFVSDVELQVVELHGQPGDVYMMDLRLLHTVAPNASDTPRMMLIQRFLLDEVRA